jgi:hypothetical protein
LSSDAAVRTSIGKLTRHPFRSMRSRTPRTASGIAATGIAYSISRNRTVRFVVNTLGEKSVKSRSPVNVSTRRASFGVALGCR